MNILNDIVSGASRQFGREFGRAGANALGEEIKAKLKADEDREREYKLQKQRDETNIESQRINAIKEIGVAFGNNQPKTINYNNIYWR